MTNARITLLAAGAMAAISISAYAIWHAATPADTPVQTKLGSVESLLGGLEARLAQNPDDANGWLLLAKSYEHMGEDGRAANAYRKAVALGMRDSEFEMRLAQSSFQGGS